MLHRTFTPPPSPAGGGGGAPAAPPSPAPPAASDDSWDVLPMARELAHVPPGLRDPLAETMKRLTESIFGPNGNPPPPGVPDFGFAPGWKACALEFADRVLAAEGEGVPLGGREALRACMAKSPGFLAIKHALRVPETSARAKDIPLPARGSVLEEPPWAACSATVRRMGGARGRVSATGWVLSLEWKRQLRSMAARASGPETTMSEAWYTKIMPHSTNIVTLGGAVHTPALVPAPAPPTTRRAWARESLRRTGEGIAAAGRPPSRRVLEACAALAEIAADEAPGTFHTTWWLRAFQIIHAPRTAASFRRAILSDYASGALRALGRPCMARSLATEAASAAALATTVCRREKRTREGSAREPGPAAPASAAAGTDADL